jgi:alkanesulfonate monooxygenase SsuD/methylene tetrahydromethanopterin reductase-like flavin-dependent oxidoreductase (luciferase family)
MVSAVVPSVSGSQALSVGVQLPTTDGFGTGYQDLRAVARAAEDAGLDSVWIGDHFSFRAPVIESFIAAATVAAVTDRIDIGFGVLIAPLRHPGWIAKQVSSLQVVAGGRVILGLGVGGEFPGEWAALGVPISERGKRMEATLHALPGLLSGHTVDLAAPWHTTVPPLTPYLGMPRLWIGGRTETALERAARHGAGWLGLWLDPPALAKRVRQLQDIAARLEQPTPPIAAEVLVHITDAPDRGERAMADFMESIYGIPFERLARYCVGGTEHEVAERLIQLVAEGLQTIVLIPAVRNALRTLPALGRIAAQLRATAPTVVQAT